MNAAAVAAAERGVALGAHPSYRDGANFGRVEHDLSRDEVARLVQFQLEELDMAARRHGTRVRYLKPHGALYNRIIHDAEQAAGVVDAVLRYADLAGEEPLPLLGLPGSVVLSRAATAGVPTVAEAFADRGYRPDGTLVPRSEPGALVTTPTRRVRRRQRDRAGRSRLGRIAGGGERGVGRTRHPGALRPGPPRVARSRSPAWRWRRSPRAAGIGDAPAGGGWHSR